MRYFRCSRFVNSITFTVRYKTLTVFIRLRSVLFPLREIIARPSFFPPRVGFHTRWAFLTGSNVLTTHVDRYFVHQYLLRILVMTGLERPYLIGERTVRRIRRPVLNDLSYLVVVLNSVTHVSIFFICPDPILLWKNYKIPVIRLRRLCDWED